MEDAQIIDLFFARQEQAIAETDAAYGRRLHTLSGNIVGSFQEAQVCVSDTYRQTWNTIPPRHPSYFFAYLAKLCRNFSLDKLDWNHVARRRAEVITLTREMEQCVPQIRQGKVLEARELGRILNSFLDSLSQQNRMVFLRRYWYVDTTAEIAARYGITENAVLTRLHRTRQKLAVYLQKEGIFL